MVCIRNVEKSDVDAFAQNAEGEDGIANAEDDDDTVADDDSEDDPLVVQFPEGDHFMLIPKVRRVLVLVSGLVALSNYRRKSELFVTPARAPPCLFMTTLFRKTKRKA